MGFVINSIDQKQHINLSEEAWIKIDEDMRNFYFNDGRANLSGFLNTVFTNFYEEAEASISYRMDELYDELERTFSDPLFDKYDEKTKRDFVNRIVMVEQNRLVKKVRSYPKGQGRKFRINNQNVAILEESIDDKFYEGSLGLYLKGIFEEYARKPYDEREKIFFKQTLNIIRLSIAQKKRLKLSLKEKGYADGSIRMERKFYVSPHSVVVDKTSKFNYLVGFAQEILPNGEIAEERMVSFRIARINQIRMMSSKSGRLTLIKQRTLEQELASKGPQFLSGDIIEAVVRFTEKGIENYQRQINMRPQYTRKIDDYTYVFHFPEVQMIYYISSNSVVMPPYWPLNHYGKNFGNATNRHLIIILMKSKNQNPLRDSGFCIFLYGEAKLWKKEGGGVDRIPISVRGWQTVNESTP